MGRIVRQQVGRTKGIFGFVEQLRNPRRVPQVRFPRPRPGRYGPTTGLVNVPMRSTLTLTVSPGLRKIWGLR